MGEKKYVIEVEPAVEAKDGKPSLGPVYRSFAAKDGFPPAVQGLDSCWDIFRYVNIYTHTYIVCMCVFFCIKIHVSTCGRALIWLCINVCEHVPHRSLLHVILLLSFMILCTLLIMYF